MGYNSDSSYSPMLPKFSPTMLSMPPEFALHPAEEGQSQRSPPDKRKFPPLPGGKPSLPHWVYLDIHQEFNWCKSQLTQEDWTEAGKGILVSAVAPLLSIQHLVGLNHPLSTPCLSPFLLYSALNENIIVMKTSI